ncbi:hypothetical protein [Bosea sp. UC22_33]|uniref:hypothetical protein n=1 Tax=Bosea sp. UC22_33 TaxID=3350165 RepID=UPI00366C0FCF
MLADGRTYAQRAVFDLSCMWDRFAIDHVEEPNESDLPLLGFAPTPTGEASDV